MAHCGGKSLWVGCGVYTVLSWYEKVQRLPRKYLPHNYSTNLSHEHWQDGSTCFCCLHQNSEQLDATAETHQTKPCFSSPLLSNFGELVLIVASALRSQLTGATPGVVLCCSKVRHVGQSEMLFLHTSVGTSGYLRHCCLSVFCAESVQLSSDLWPQHSTKHLPLRGIYLFRSDAHFELQRVGLTLSARAKALSCCSRLAGKLRVFAR